MKDPRCIVGWHNDAGGADLPPDSEPVSPDKVLVVCSRCGRRKIVSRESGPFTLRAPDNREFDR
jgi:hypothetical protein